MPEQRDCIVDRNSLALVGNVTVAAVKVGKETVCSGSDLQITGAELVDGMDRQYVVPTLMYDPVLIRMQPAMGRLDRLNGQSQQQQRMGHPDLCEYQRHHPRWQRHDFYRCDEHAKYHQDLGASL